MSTRLASVLLLLIAPIGAAAEVVDRALGGFTSRTTVTIEASPERALRAMLVP